MLRSFKSFSIHQLLLVIKWRRIRWAGHVDHIEYLTNAYKKFVGKHERVRRLGRPKFGEEGDIKEIVCKDVT